MKNSSAHNASRPPSAAAENAAPTPAERPRTLALHCEAARVARLAREMADMTQADFAAYIRRSTPVRDQAISEWEDARHDRTPSTKHVMAMPPAARNVWARYLAAHEDRHGDDAPRRHLELVREVTDVLRVDPSHLDDVERETHEAIAVLQEQLAHVASLRERNKR